MEHSLSAPDNVGAGAFDEDLCSDESKIGEGTFAQVFWIPPSPKSWKSKAVKRASGVNRRALQQEWKMLKNLDHPNIVTVTDDFWTSPTRSFMVMEYVNGCDLFYALTDKRASTLAIVHISKCILSALDYIHKQNIFHKDVKLDNILIGERNIDRVNFDTTVKLCDFGMSAYGGTTEANLNCGSLIYAAPEILLQTISPRAAADIYSFSVVFYALCFSFLPYGEDLVLGPHKKSLEARLIMQINKAYVRFKKHFTERVYRKIYKHTSYMKPEDRYNAHKILKSSLFSKKHLAKLQLHPATEAPDIRDPELDELRLSRGTKEDSS